MKKILGILILALFTLQTPSQANDIRDFQIEGMSVGDSLLDYFSEEDINSHSKYWWKDRKYFMVSKSSPSFEIYGVMQFALKNNDKNYIIQGLSGKILFEKNIQNCLKKKNEAIKELSDFFKNDIENIENKIESHKYDETGKSKQHITYINLKSKNTIDIYCEDWSEKTKLITNFQVRILNKEFTKYLNYKAYK